MIVTRKIQIAVLGDQNEKNRAWEFIRQLDNDVFKAANQIISDQWFYDAFEEKVMEVDKAKIQAIDDQINNLYKDRKGLKGKQTDKVDKNIQSLKKQKNKITSDARNSARAKLKELFEVGRQQLSWRMIAAQYPEWGSIVFDALVQRINKDYTNDYIDVLTGKKSVRRYRKGMPIPFRARGRKFTEEDGSHVFHWIKNVKFVMVYRRDRSSRKAEIQRIINGEYRFGDSSIQVKGKKLFLLLSLDHPDPDHSLIADKELKVEAGIQIPVSCQVDGHNLVFGSSDDIMKFRLQQQSKYRRHQKRLKLAIGGKGRKKKLQKLENFKAQEKNWIRTYNHKLSKQILNLAIKYQCGIINFFEVKQASLTDDQKKFLGRNWAGHQLKEMVSYKAKINGIQVFVHELEMNREEESSLK